jgi:hypothetical protein
MTLVNRVRRFSVGLAASAIVAIASPVSAQEISDAHLKAARDAVAAINATDMYDTILPQAAAALKAELIQKNPDLQAVITSTVDETALKLAGRRTDLEKEAALAYARVFSAEDLNNIATFYTSPTGQKLLQDGPIVSREVAKAAEIWQRGIARDLAEASGKELAAQVKDVQAPATDGSQAPAPATDGSGTPAPETPAPAPAN